MFNRNDGNSVADGWAGAVMQNLHAILEMFWTDRRTNGQMDRRTDGGMDGQTDGLTNQPTRQGVELRLCD